MSSDATTNLEAETATPASEVIPEPVVAQIPPPDEPTAPAPETDSPKQSRALRSLLVVLPWLAVAVVLPFVILFIMTALPRLWLPFSLEWMEDQSCEQALRFAQGKALYPKPEEWVPYMYAPFYHMTLGAIFKATGDYAVGWGRLISFISSLLTGLGIGFIIFDRTKKWPASIAAALLYFAFFKPTGYWYDIARLDAYAFVLATWGMYFCLKLRPTTWQILLGGLLLCLGTFTKQTIAAVLIFCMFWLVVTQFRAARMSLIAMTLLFVNFLFLFQSAGNDNFFKYTVDIALHSQDNPGVLFPKYQNMDMFMKNVPEPKTRVHTLQEYWKESVATPPEIWSDAGRHIWLLWLLIPVWLLVCLVRLQRPCGIVYLAPALLLSWGGVASLAKNGGYINNLLPVFLGITILTGFAIAGIQRAFKGISIVIPSLLLPCLLFAQIYQPWNLPPNTALGIKDLVAQSKVNNVLAGQRWQVVKDEWNPDDRKALQDYMNYLDRRVGDPNLKSSASFGTKMRYQLGRWTVAGLPWFPSHLQPSPESGLVYDRFKNWLFIKKQQGEPVWVLHHQWFAFLQGHPTEFNADMMRLANYQGIPVPARALQMLTNRQYKWLVLDMGELQWEWLPPGFNTAIQANYDFLGPLPAYQGVMNGGALLPITGAEVRPYALYRAKDFSGNPTIDQPAGNTSAPPKAKEG